MDFQSRIESIFHDLKNEVASNISPVIPVLHAGEHIANLQVITKSMLSDDNVIALLTKWRSEHQDAFPSQFTVTHAGTKNWGQKQLLDLPDRILFFLETLDGKPFAHLGLFRCNYQEKSCEIDNVVRGENIIPGSMTDALRALIQWVYNTLQMKQILLQVFSDNQQAIALYKRCGFVEVRKKPLKKIIEQGVIKFVDIKDSTEKADRYFLVMKLNKS